MNANRWLFKIADFGVSIRTLEKRTIRVKAAGTAWYMPPEANGEKSLISA